MSYTSLPSVTSLSSLSDLIPAKFLPSGARAAHAPEGKNIAGAQEIQHILKIAALKVPLFLTDTSSPIL